MGETKEILDAIERILKGDSKSFEIILEEYGDRIYRFILKQLYNKNEAEDLTQEIFIAVYNSLPKLKEPDKLKYWIYSIARNYFKNHINRQVKKNNKIIYTDEFSNISSKFDQPDEMTDFKITLEKVKKHLNELETELRETFVLVVFEQMNYKEVALLLNIPEGTVKSRIFRARNILKDKFENQ